jgi:hypothetical protein
MESSPAASPELLPRNAPDRVWRMHKDTTVADAKELGAHLGVGGFSRKRRLECIELVEAHVNSLSALYQDPKVKEYGRMMERTEARGLINIEEIQRVVRMEQMMMMMHLWQIV